MIYLISDDSFFSLGLLASSMSRGKAVTTISVSSLPLYVNRGLLTENDNLIINLSCERSLSFVMHILRLSDTGVVFVYNLKDSCLPGQPYSGILSSRLSLEDFWKYIDTHPSGGAVRKMLTSFTQRERLVISMLLTKSVSEISGILNVGEKEIYQHKARVRKKLGLGKLNDKFLLIYHHISVLA